MRIGLFADTYPPYINGVSTSIFMLKEALEKQGHTVYVVTINSETLSYKYDEEERVLRIPGLQIGIYDYRITGIYPVRVINKIKKWNLDVIHSHTEFSIGTFARIIAKQLKIPVVHTCHTMYEDYVYYITKGYFKAASKKLVEYFLKFYCDKTLTELIVPTKKTYDWFKEKYKIERDVHIVPTGINLEKFNQKKNANKTKIILNQLGAKKDDFLILYLGRIAKEKSIDFLLESHQDLIKINKKYKLIIVGDGPELQTYIDYVNDNNLSDNVIFTGKVSLEEVPHYYKTANVFVTASKTETQGLTVIEAMATGIVPVCVKDESFSNVIINDFNGFMFENKDEYKNIINELYSNSKLTKKISSQAKVSSEEFSSEHFANRVLNVYKVAIKKNNEKKGIFSNVIRMFKGE